MKQLAIGILLWTVLFTSCSSVDGDAQKAAELNRESMECAEELELEEAEELYRESRAIIARYKDTAKFEEFYMAYNKYMAQTVDK